jgi:hypothetical protein
VSKFLSNKQTIMPGPPQAEPSMKKRQALWSPTAGFIATQAVETDPGSALQPMSFAASKEWFKLLAHRSPAPYGTERGVPAAKHKKIRALQAFFI